MTTTDDFITDDIVRRVEAGAAWLDENKPGWVDQIDLDRLDMYERPDCILGQLYGNFNNVAQYFGDEPTEERPLSHDAAVSFGFFAANLERCEEEYAILQSAWKRLITTRRRDTTPTDAVPEVT